MRRLVIVLGLLILLAPCAHGDEADIKALAAGVKDYRTKFRLIALGRHALEPLMLQVADKDAWLVFESKSAVRWIAHHALRKPGESAALAGDLLRYLHGAAVYPPAPRAFAAELLGDLGAVEAVEDLWKAARHGTDGNPVAVAALDALRRIPGRGVTEKLAALADTVEGAPRDLLFGVLGARGGEAGLGPLLRHAREGNVAAIRALGVGGFAEAEPLLTGLCKERNPEAFDALLAIGKRQADTALLARLYEHARDDVQRVAVIRATAGTPVTEEFAIQVLSKAMANPALKGDAQKALLNACRGFSPAGARMVYGSLLGEAADEAVLLRALAGLGRLGAEGSSALVLPYLAHEKAAVRTTAVRALGRIPELAATAALIDGLRSAEDADMQSLFIRTLQERGSTEAMDVLAHHMTKNNDKGLRAEAAVALASVASQGGEAEARRIYLKMLGAGVREPALRGLARTGDAASLRVIPQLTGAMDPAMLTMMGATLVAIADRVVAQPAPAPDDHEAVVAAYRWALRAGLMVENKLRLLGEPVEITARGGRVSAWWLVGAFAAPDTDSWTRAEFPEKAVDLASLRDLGGSTYRVEPVQVGGKDGIVDLDSLFEPNDNVTAYAFAEIEVRKARDAVLKMGSDDGIRCWLNGALVHSKLVPRGITPDEDVVKVSLREGSNILLVKVCELGGGWGFCLRIEDDKGRPLKFKIR